MAATVSRGVGVGGVTKRGRCPWPSMGGVQGFEGGEAQLVPSFCCSSPCEGAAAGQVAVSGAMGGEQSGSVHVSLSRGGIGERLSGDCNASALTGMQGIVLGKRRPVFFDSTYRANGFSYHLFRHFFFTSIQNMQGKRIGQLRNILSFGPQLACCWIIDSDAVSWKNSASWRCCRRPLPHPAHLSGVAAGCSTISQTSGAEARSKQWFRL